MNITPITLYDFDRLDAELKDFDSKGRRPSGLHVSGLVYAAFKNIFNTEKGPIEGEQPFVRTLTGFLWERMLEHAFTEYMNVERKMTVKQLPCEKDGVHGTPDGINGDYVEEYKATWRSKRKWDDDPEREFWMWVTQVKAYCYMTGKLKARFFIFWVNGDYSFKKARGPQVTTCEMEFTQAELVENWEMLLSHAGTAKVEKHE